MKQLLFFILSAGSAIGQTMVGDVAEFDEVTTTERDALSLQADAGLVYNVTTAQFEISVDGSTWDPLGGIATFLGASDTPASYSGEGAKFVKVKSDATGLEFVTVTLDFLSNAIADYATEASPDVAEDYVIIRDDSASTWDKVQIDNFLAGGPFLSDTIANYTTDASPATGADFVLFRDTSAGTWDKVLIDDLGTGGGGSTFLGLSDTPSSYAGQSDLLVGVNGAGDALTFFAKDYLSDDVNLYATDSTPATSADFVLFRDTSAGTWDKVLVGDLGAGGGSFTIDGLTSSVTADDDDLIAFRDVSLTTENKITGKEFIGDVVNNVLDGGGSAALGSKVPIVTSSELLSLSLQGLYNGAGVLPATLTTPANDDYLLIYDTSALSAKRIAKSDLVSGSGGGGGKVARLNKTFSSGTDGGTNVANAITAVSGWTESYDADSLVAVSGSSVTLAAGNRYIVRASHVFFRTLQTQLFINNTTDSEITSGLSHFFGSSTNASTGPAVVLGIVDATAGAKTFRVEYFTSNSRASDGLGKAVGSGRAEVYSTIDIEVE